MGRLVDVDELIFLIKHKKDILSGIGGDEYSIKAFDYIIKLIENQPIAYNVEKVVAELEDKSQYCIPINGQAFTGIKTEYAIDIVKAGGVDD